MTTAVLALTLLAAAPVETRHTSPPLEVIAVLGGAPLVHEGGISAMAFTPDGKELVTLGSFGKAQGWNLATRTSEWHGGDSLGGESRTTLLALGLKRILAVGDAQTPLLFDGETTTPLSANVDCDGPGCRTNGLGALLGGNRLVTVSTGTLAIWDLGMKEPMRAIAIDPSDVEVTALGATAQGSLVALGFADGKLQVIDVKSESKRWEIGAHDGAVSALAFNKDGKHFVSAGVDGWARTWTTTGQQQAQLRLSAAKSDDEPSGAVISLSSDARLALIARTHLQSQGTRVALWDLTTKRRRFERSVAAGAAFAFSPDSKVLALASLPSGLPWLDELDSVQLIDAATGKTLPGTAHDGFVASVAFSPDGKQVLSGGKDGVAALWDVVTQKRLATWSGHKGPITDVAFLPDGKRAVTSSEDGSTRVWNIKTGQQIGMWQAPFHSSKAATADESTNASPPSRILEISSDGAFALVPANDAACAAETGTPSDACLSNDRLALIDVPSGGRLATLRCSDSSTIPYGGFGPEQKSLVTACPSGAQAISLQTWDLYGAARTSVDFRPASTPQAFTGSEDGFTLIAADTETPQGTRHAVLRWDSSSGTVKSISTAHERALTALALLHDGLALSASWDGSVRAFAADSGEERAHLELWRGRADVPRSLAVSPDGKKIVVGTARGSLVLLAAPVATGAEADGATPAQ